MHMYIAAHMHEVTDSHFSSDLLRSKIRWVRASSWEKRDTCEAAYASQSYIKEVGKLNKVTNMNQSLHVYTITMR